MNEHFTQRRDPVRRLTQAEYRRARMHQAAGPVSELLFAHTRFLYCELGATHWLLTCDQAGTVLLPVIVDP